MLEKKILAFQIATSALPRLRWTVTLSPLPQSNGLSHPLMAKSSTCIIIVIHLRLQSNLLLFSRLPRGQRMAATSRNCLSVSLCIHNLIYLILHLCIYFTYFVIFIIYFTDHTYIKVLCCKTVFSIYTVWALYDHLFFLSL